MRTLWVSTLGTGQSYIPGSGNGAVLKLLYTWAGEQVAQTDTCLLNATVPRTETFAYDQLVRLTTAGRPVNNFAATGGAFNARSYGYDGPGNRTSEAREDCGYALTYGNSSHPDQLTRQASSCTSSILRHDYAYDSDGRVTAKTWENDSSGSPAYRLNFNYGASDSTSGGALDTVFKAVNVNGAFYNYYYDSSNKRRLKVNPRAPATNSSMTRGTSSLWTRGTTRLSAPASSPRTSTCGWEGGRSFSFEES